MKRRARAKKLLKDADLKECLWLIFNGIPASVAFGMSDQEIAAWLSASDERRHWMAITFSVFNGAEFDMASMSFKEQGK